jgi:hypothetical protein
MSYSDIVLADSGLVAYWRLGEPSGTTVTDAGPNNIDGEYINAPTLGVGGLIEDADTAVSFNGTNEYIEVTHQAALNISTEITIELWLRWSASLPADFINLIGKPGTDLGTADNFVLWIYNNEDGHAFLYFQWGASGYLDGTMDVVDGGVYHLVITTDGIDEAVMYVNGQEIVSTTFIPLTLAGAPNTDNLYIAHFLDGASAYQAWAGVLDEIALYDRLFSEIDALAHYEAGTESVTIIGDTFSAQTGN